jgi:hypothetical protein
MYRAVPRELNEVRSDRLADDWPAARIRELLPAAWLADQRRQQQQADRAAETVDDADAAIAPCNDNVAVAA